MPMELIKTTREQYKMIGKGSTQVLIEGDLIVPDINPDIAACLRVGARPIMVEEKAAEDRVGFKGDLQLNVIYMAKKSDRVVHSMKEVLSFEDFINIDETTRLSDVEVIAELSHLEYRLINDRKVGVKAIVTVTAFSWEKAEEEYLQGAVSEGLQTREVTTSIEQRTENKNDRFVIKEELEVGNNKPDIADILDCQVEINRKEVKAVRDGINIKGEAVVSLLYTSNSDESPVEVAEFSVPFNGTIEINGITEEMRPYARLSVERIEAYVVPNENGEDKILDLEVNVDACAGATSQEEIQLIEDAYSTTEDIEIETRIIKQPIMTGRTEARMTVKETVAIEESYPSILQVTRAWGTCYTDNVTPEENGVVLEGGTSVEVMYIANDDDMPVQVLNFMIPFEQRVELNGASTTSEVEVECRVENVGINMLTDREIEVTVTLVINAESYENIETEVINNIIEVEGSRLHQPSLTIYVVQKGDSLWKIAKKFNTTIANILEVNEIDNPDLIYPGEKILILRSPR